MFASAVVAFALTIGPTYHWLMTTPLHGSQRRCILADAYNFGTCYERARQYRILAVNHRDDETMFHRVWMWNGKDAAYRWKAEAEWRRLCWDAIEDALNPRLCPSRRLACLESLYDLLGEEAYWEWAMPFPTPQYRVR